MTETISRQPKNHGTGHADNFQTPPEALEPLLPYLPKDWTIWEPACGAGNLVRGLETAGYRAVGSDILTDQDFLTWEPFRNVGGCQCRSCAAHFRWDALVTNPPFSLKHQFLGRAYQLGKPFAFLLPLTVFDSQKRQALFAHHGVEVILLPKRVNFETPNGKGSSAWFATCWVTWGLQIGSSLTFHRPGLQKELALL